jgi:hypothetical protein
VRGIAFVLAVAAIAVGAYAVLRWYGTSNYYVTIRGQHVVVVQGQQGGFLWWKPKVVRVEPYGRAQMPLEVVVLLTQGGVDQPTLQSALEYSANMHDQWLIDHGRGPATTTTTTSTTIAGSTTVGSSTGGN